MKKGLLFTIMGVTNTGKTTQIELLEETLQKQNIKFHTLKYPIYKFETTGPKIFACMKGGNPEKISALELQQLCAQNRKDFEPELKKLLTKNDIVIAEMYTGTGIAYGMGEGLDKNELIEMNKGLLVPHLSILLDGKRFLESIEKGHRFEEDAEKTEKIRQYHLELAKDFGWKVLRSDRSRERVAKDIWQEIFMHMSGLKHS